MRKIPNYISGRYLGKKKRLIIDVVAILIYNLQKTIKRKKLIVAFLTNVKETFDNVLNKQLLI